MTTPLLTTKLYIPPPRPSLVTRPRLIERLNAGLHRKLTPMRRGVVCVIPPALWLLLEQESGLSMLGKAAEARAA